MDLGSDYCYAVVCGAYGSEMATHTRVCFDVASLVLVVRCPPDTLW